MTVPIGTIRRFFNRCLRYMSAYRIGLVGPALDYAVKKYKGHRRIPENIAKLDLELSYENHKRRK